jgi:hypothetical protein
LLSGRNQRGKLALPDGYVGKFDADVTARASKSKPMATRYRVPQAGKGLESLFGNLSASPLTDPILTSGRA